MKLVEINLKNFRPYYGDITINPTVEENKPLVLIQGKNDTGKTSLFSAIRFCLYGADSREERDSVINRQAVTESNGTTKVELTFDQEGEIFTIERGIEFTQVTESDDRTADDWYREIRGPEGTIVSRRANEPEYRKIINRLIPENIAQFFLFDAEKLERFEEDHDETVRESIETVLGIQEIENAIDDLSDRESKFQRELANTKSTVKTVNELRETQRENLEEIERIGDEDSGEISEKQEQLKTKRESLREVNEALQKAEGADDLQKELDEVETDLKNAREGLNNDLIPRRNEIRREVGPLIATTAAETFLDNYEIEGVQGEAAVISELLDQNTCICGEELTSDKKDRLLNRFKRLHSNEREDLRQLRELAENLSIDVDTKLQAYQQIQQQIGNQQSEIEALEANREEIKNELDTIEQQYSEELKQKKNTLEQEIEGLDEEIQDLEDRRAILKNKNENLQQRISSMGGATEKERRYENLIELAKNCRNAFGEIKEELVESRRKDVEEAASKTFQRLTNRPDHYKGLKITPNYELRVLTEGAERSIAEQRPSAGQRQIIAYSFIAGLSKFTTRNAPVVIDTPIGRLDPEHKDNLVRFYHEFSDQVFILYQPNELEEEDIETMEEYISKHYRITIQDDGSSSTIEELPHIMSVPSED